jgi:glutamine amidotransferase
LDRTVTIIDFGIGNLKSVQNAFTYLGCDVQVTANPEQVRNARTLVLPGVGSFRAAMNRLNESGLATAIKDAVGNQDVKLLGICLGLQLIGQTSTEDGATDGLKLVNGHTDAFKIVSGSEIKIPHVGFNTVNFPKESNLYRGLENPSDFYFTHGYRMEKCDPPARIGWTQHGEQFVASIEFENIYATQFHPEKSQSNGLMVLKNFVEI